MKNCEYFQMLLSGLHDSGADINQNDELQKHLHTCSDCKKFYNLLQNQSTQIQNLPKIDFENAPQINQTIFEKIWRTKISIPLPAAAAVFIFLIGSYWLIDNNKQEEQQIIEVEQKQADYQNVQFVKFSPQPAVLVESNNN